MCKSLIYLLYAPFIKEIKGINKLPKRGGYIIAANHSSYGDAPLLQALVYRQTGRKVHFYAIKSLFEHWYGRLLFGKVLGCIKVNGSFEKGVSYLEKNEIVGIFPEGGRTHNGKIRKVEHTGVGALALATKKKIVPVGLQTFDWWPRQKTLPRLKRNIAVKIGKSMKFKRKVTRKNAKLATQQIMKEIKRLVG